MPPSVVVSRLQKPLFSTIGINNILSPPCNHIQSSIELLQKAFKAMVEPQSWMDSFFAMKSNSENDATKAMMRKAEVEASKGKGKNKGNKKATVGGSFNRKK